MQDLTGRRFGAYRLLRRLGEGGSAFVYLAERSGEFEIRQLAALKLLKPQFAADSDARTAFLDEMRVVSKLRHATVVQMLDMGGDEDSLYLAMEFVDGLNLSQILDRAIEGRLPVAHACFFGAQVADALRYAHELSDDHGQPLGIVHRDVTPENILISAAGAVKLSDFGIALAASRTSKTEVGLVRGKPHYISPEQVAGEAVSPRTDLYSLGVVLYESITGSLPFVGDNPMAILTRVREGGARPIAQLAPQIPEDLARLIDSMLQRDPGARPGSATEVHRRLLTCAVDDGRPLSSSDLRNLIDRAQSSERTSRASPETPLNEPPSGLWQGPTVRRILPSSRPPRRPYAVVGTSAAVILLSVVVALILLWQASGRRSQTSPQKTRQPPRAEPSPPMELAAEEIQIAPILEAASKAPKKATEDSEIAGGQTETTPAQPEAPPVPATQQQNERLQENKRVSVGNGGEQAARPDRASLRSLVVRILDRNELELADFPALRKRVESFSPRQEEERKAILDTTKLLEATAESVHRRIERCKGKIRNRDTRQLYEQARVEYAFRRIDIANSLLHAMCAESQ